jgi:predicted nucleotidyltransferase
MPRIFTTLRSSRFLDQEAVVSELQTCARRAKSECAGIIAVYLFGSLAAGTATPRSDADIIIEIPDASAGKEAVHETAMRSFLDAPVPVDLFVRSTDEIISKRGIAGALARKYIVLA